MLEKLKNLKRASKSYEKKMKKLDKQFARLDEITSSLQGTLQDNLKSSFQGNLNGGYYGYSKNLSQ